MKICCGTDEYFISEVKSVVVRKVTTRELEEIGKTESGIDNNNRINSSINTFTDVSFTSKDVEYLMSLGYNMEKYFPSKNKAPLLMDLEKVIEKYTYEIAARLPAPQIEKSDLPYYAKDENPKHWAFQRSKSHNFIVNGLVVEENTPVKWTFEIRYNSDNGAREKTTRTILLRDIMAALKSLLDIPRDKFKKSKSKSEVKEFGKAVFDAFLSINVPSLAKQNDVDFFTGKDSQYYDTLHVGFVKHTYEEIQRDIKPVYKQYLKIKEKADAQRQFFEKYANKSILCLDFKNRTTKKYLEDYCGFDIFEKELEIRKKLNSNNEGEKNVEYALEWFVKANENGHVVQIAGDCESRYRHNCILLNKPDFIDDPQEYDHVLVTSAGVVLIETKHWKGRVEIRTDGQWVRESEHGITGTENPKFQMRRHELMMKKILQNVAVHSLLCFSNGKIIIEGKENFTDYPIVTVEQLEEKLSEICSQQIYSDSEIVDIVNLINEHKVNVSR